LKIRVTTGIRFLNFAALSAFVFVLLLGLVPGAATTKFPTSALQEASNGARCDVKGSTELTINCDYSPAPNDSSQAGMPRISLDHASFSFETNDDSHMKIGLTITNRGATGLPETRMVYISIDGPDGKNYMRRPLPHVALSKIGPQQTLAFSETLLSPAFPRGTYTIHLWIPSVENPLKFDPAHNLLFESVGVPDSVTGLNTLATFTVTTMSGHKKRAH